MRILVLNGSPKRKGTISILLTSVIKDIREKCEIEYFNLYDMEMRPCIACMKCRPDGICALPADDAHRLGEKIRNADALIIGTPTHWGNMSSQLKVLFDRNVPVFMGESKNGFPIPRQKGKPAIIVTACSTPWPFNFIAAESRGAINAVKEVLHYGGYNITGKIVKPGSKTRPEISSRLSLKAEKLGIKLYKKIKNNKETEL